MVRNQKPHRKKLIRNEFFVSVFTREDKENIPIPPTRHTEENLETIQITPDCVCKKLKRLNPEKSPAHNNWHPYFLREIADVICIPISFLFNKSLKEGTHKSLTSVIAKVVESLIRDEFLSHLVRYDVLSDCQHGFVPSRNCTTQLLLCLEDWTLMRENN